MAMATDSVDRNVTHAHPHCDANCLQVFFVCHVMMYKTNKQHVHHHIRTEQVYFSCAHKARNQKQSVLSTNKKQIVHASVVVTVLIIHHFSSLRATHWFIQIMSVNSMSKTVWIESCVR